MTDFVARKPESPDYERLNRIVRDIDRAFDEGRTMPELVAPIVDLYSAQYLAERRADLACAQLGLNPRMRPFLAATFLNAFTVGVIWERESNRDREWERHRDRQR